MVTSHTSAGKAYEATTKEGIIAVKVTAYVLDSKYSVSYYSFKGDSVDDFPYSLGSNQSIEEIDQDTI